MWPVLEQCAGYVLVGRLVWGVVGVCRAVPAKRAGCVWGVPGVCRECARCVLREHAWVVLRVCGVCAGSVPGVCGRAWVGGVPGVCRVVCWVRWGCAMQGIQRGVCRSVRVCRERVPDVGCAGVCRVPGVCRECACVPGVCRCVRRGCVGCVACA